MSNPLAKPEELTVTLSRYKPIHLFTIVLVSIFSVEFGVMIILDVFFPPPILGEDLIDAISLTAILFPVLYYFAFKPLIRQEALFDALSQNSPDCIKLFDSKGVLLFINNGGLKEHRFKNLQEAQEKGFMDSMVPESQTAFTQAFGAALSGDSVSIEVRHTKKGSNREYCLEAFSPIQTSAGEISGVLAVSRDISVQKNFEKELELKIDNLNKANKLMVGRELRMVELKKEIADFREKAAEQS